MSREYLVVYFNKDDTYIIASGDEKEFLQKYFDTGVLKISEFTRNEISGMIKIRKSDGFISLQGIYG